MELALGQTSQALQHYNQLIGLRPRADSYLSRATYFKQHGPITAWRQDIQTALQLDPTNTEALQMRDQAAAAQ
jgi:Tfp pilus assembly protein PilF